MLSSEGSIVCVTSIQHNFGNGLIGKTTSEGGGATALILSSQCYRGEDLGTSSSDHYLWSRPIFPDADSTPQAWVPPD